MKLTARSEYALLALVYLARNVGRKVNATEIAKHQHIPVKFLEQIIIVLKDGGLLLSTKGRHGGYSLAKDAESVTLAEVVRLFDGPLAPTDSVSKFYYRPTPIERETKLQDIFQEVRDLTAKIMEQTTIADII